METIKKLYDFKIVNFLLIGSLFIAYIPIKGAAALLSDSNEEDALSAIWLPEWWLEGEKLGYYSVEHNEDIEKERVNSGKEVFQEAEEKPLLLLGKGEKKLLNFFIDEHIDEPEKEVKKIKKRKRCESIDIEETIFECDECGQRCVSNSALIIHTRIRTGEKPYKCQFCNRQFSQKGTLNVHIRIHTGEKPFVCSECDQRFNRRSKLAAHKKAHTGEKLFACNQKGCVKSFSRLDDLKGHEKSHKGEKSFVCGACSRGFSRRFSLKKHTRIHTGEKLFACDECGKNFSKKALLTRHKKIHAGENHFS